MKKLIKALFSKWVLNLILEYLGTSKFTQLNATYSDYKVMLEQHWLNCYGNLILFTKICSILMQALKIFLWLILEHFWITDKKNKP